MAKAVTKSEIVHRFAVAEIAFKEEKDINHGVQLQFDNGAKINVYNTGKLLISGKNQVQSNYILYWSSDPEEFDRNLGVMQRQKKRVVKNKAKGKGNNIKSCISETVNSITSKGIVSTDDDLPPWD